MTRNLKKDEELKILHRYLKASGTGEFQNIEPGEQPDFIISYENMKIGVEITEYHSDRRCCIILVLRKLRLTLSGFMQRGLSPACRVL